MDGELKCSVCCRNFTKPVLLPCSHSLCLGCALSIQAPVQQFVPVPASSEEGATTSTTVGLPEYDFPDIDKVSILSETDSGVVCNSRPNSYVGTPNVSNIITQAIQGSSIGICCPACKKTVYLDENGANSLPKNKVLEVIVEKYTSGKSMVVRCQLCEKDPKEASVMCEQCEVFYCDSCREHCHPARGPLAKHNLVAPSAGKDTMRAKNKSISIKDVKCSDHGDENISMYCLICKVPLCCLCMQEGQHVNHDVQALGAICKAQKNELSQNLQALSERARSGTEFIQKLKGMCDKVQETSVEFEASIVAQCDALIEAMKRRKQQLLAQIAHDKEYKVHTLKDQVSHCTAVLQRTTGLLQFSIEVLKESDAISFLQVSGGLINRVANSDLTFCKDMELRPRVSHEFELTLDDRQILHAIETLNFLQKKRQTYQENKDAKEAPGPPMIIPEECSAENNSVTIAWQPFPGSVIDAYILELDDANAGAFREVYCGPETICTVDGLHFDSMYNARVKAFNHAGESAYSECICLQTAEVAWFSFDAITAHPDIIFSNDNTTVTCSSYDMRVVLGAIGFSKGVHYWEIVVDRYDHQPDPAFGIARFDVNKEQMLGKDDKGWSLYIDNTRSWFMTNDTHFDRTEGGIRPGSVIGVKLDLNNHTLCYYLNDEPHGPITFTGLHGVFFPAVSLNRNVQLTLHTGLDIPNDSDSDGE